MIRTRNTLICACMAAVLAALTGTTPLLAQQSWVNIDFNSGSSPNYAGVAANAGAAGTWQGINGLNTTTLNVLDQFNSASPLDVTLAGFKSTYNGNAGVNAGHFDINLVGDYHYANDGNTALVTLAGFRPNTSADIYIYANGDQSNQNARVDLGGSIQTTTGASGSTTNLVLGEDYLVYSNAIASAEGIISFTMTGDASPYAAISGLQIQSDFGDAVVGSNGLSRLTDLGDLDLRGTFPYAVNLHAAASAFAGDITVGGLTFVSETNSIPGFTISNHDGSDSNVGRGRKVGLGDAALNNLVDSTADERNAGASLDINLDVQVGEEYKLQLLLHEGYFNAADVRIFDVLIEGELLVNNLDIIDQVGHVAGDNDAILFTHTFVAEDDTLNISLNAGVNNSIISAFSLENLAKPGFLFQIAAGRRAPARSNWPR